MSVATRQARPAEQQRTFTRLSLANAIRTGKQLPSRLILHAQGGMGKTSFAAQAPKPFFLLSKGETGLHTLIDSKQIPETPSVEVEEWEQVAPLLDELERTDHGYQTLVLDVIDGFEKLCNSFVCDTQYGGDWGTKGFADYAKGNRYVAANPWRQLLVALDRIRETKRMSIIMLAHTAQAAFSNPTGTDYTRYVPNLYKDVWQLTYDWADIVLFGQPVVSASKEKGDKKAKGYGGETRVFRTTWDAAFDAKHRHGLPPEIEMGSTPQEAWTNFRTALQKAKESSPFNQPSTPVQE